MDEIIQRCIPEVDMICILEACYSPPVRGFHGGTRTTHKILQCGYYWPIIYKDAHNFSSTCYQYQCQGNISRCHELPMTPILELELFYVWGIDFMVLL